MKRNFYTLTFLLFFLLSSLIARSQTYSVNIDSIAKIGFPLKPTAQQTAAGKIYSIAKGSQVYLVLIQDLRKEKLANLATSNLDVFYEGIITGTLKTAKGTLLKKQQVQIEGLKGLDFEYVASEYHDSTSTGFLPEYRFHRDLVLNGRLINCIYWTTANDVQTPADVKLRNTFFNSLKITVDKAHRSQSPDMGLGLKLSSKRTVIFVTLGIVLGAMILLVIILYFLQRGRRKKQNKYNG